MRRDRWPLPKSAAFAFGANAVLWALIVFALAGCAGIGGCGTVLMPPPPFQGAPAVDPFVQILPLKTVEAACAAHERLPYGIRYFDGCTIPASFGGFRFRIVVASAADVGIEPQRCVFRHEQGHANGWPANHPGGHYE